MLRAPMRAMVILPTYDEAENVLPLSADVLSRDPRIEVVVVDDNSPDGTGDLVEKARVDEPRLVRMRDTMTHRGPDASGVWHDEARHVAYGVKHLQYFLERHPEREGEIHSILDVGEQAIFTQ